MDALARDIGYLVIAAGIAATVLFAGFALLVAFSYAFEWIVTRTIWRDLRD